MAVAQALKHNKLVRTALAGPIHVRRWWLRRQASALAEILERLRSLTVGDITLRIDEFDGEFELQPSSHLLHRLLASGVYEPQLARLFGSYVDPERDVLDIGANVGFYTVLAGRRLRSGRVLAAEPAQAACERLRLNIRRNHVEERVIVFPGLVSSAAGEGDLHFVPGLEEYSSMGALVHPSLGQAPQAQSRRVEMASLDDLVQAHALRPALLKIDVEGAEGLVLEGARQVLKEFRPVVISELSEPLLRGMGTSAREIIAQFRDLGYRVTDPLGRTAPGGLDYGDILCVPVERAAA